MFNCLTKDEMLVCLKYDLRDTKSAHVSARGHMLVRTYARTLENSVDGDMTKLSFELDQEMRCWMVWSSSILHGDCQRTQSSRG